MFSTEAGPELRMSSLLSSAGEVSFNQSYEDFGNDTALTNETIWNTTKSVSHPDILLPYHVLLGIAIYLTIVGILSTFGNTLFILTVIRWRYLRNNSHMLLLLNMAVSDLAISIIGYPYTTISGYVGEWIFGSVICQLYAFLCFTFSQVSMNTLVAVSVFRYIAICHPHMKHFLTTRTSVWALAIVWCHALFWTIAPLVGWSSYSFEPTRISCSINWNNRDINGVSYVIGATMFCYASHIVILIWCYKSIFWMVTRLKSKSRLGDITFRRRRPMRNTTKSTIDSTLSQSATENETLPPTQRNEPDRYEEIEPPDSPPPLPRCQSLIVFSFTTENLSEMELHVLGMNIAMVASFIIFWTPYAWISCISAFYEKLSPIWYIFPTIFAKTSCMMNPILYGLTNSFLRKQFWLYLRGFLRLTTEIENFEVMRQRQQDGLYNKEGIFMGKKAGVGAVVNCTCDGCIASRSQIKLLIEQQKMKSSAGVSPAVSSIIVNATNKMDENAKDAMLLNGNDSGIKAADNKISFDDPRRPASSDADDEREEEDNDETGEKRSLSQNSTNNAVVQKMSSDNDLENSGSKIIKGEENQCEEKKLDVGVTSQGSHPIQSNSIILNVNTLPVPKDVGVPDGESGHLN